MGEAAGAQLSNELSFCKVQEEPLRVKVEPKSAPKVWQKQILLAPGFAKLSPLPRLKKMRTDTNFQSIGAGRVHRYSAAKLLSPKFEIKKKLIIQAGYLMTKF